MIVYAMVRTCKEPHARGMGPPVGVYYSEELAKLRLQEWKIQNLWDTVEYQVIPAKVVDTPKAHKDKVLYVIVKICEGYIESAESYDDIVLFLHKVNAESQMQAALKTCSDKEAFLLKPLEVRGKAPKNFLCTKAKTLFRMGRIKR